MKYNFEKITQEAMKANQLLEGRSTSLAGKINASYDELIEIFGKPTGEYDGGESDLPLKTRAEWEIIVEGDNGESVGIDIYDWKSEVEYLPDVAEWHVAGEEYDGGLQKANAVEMIKQIIKDHRLQRDNEYPENPSFKTIMETGTYSDQQQAYKILTTSANTKDKFKATELLFDVLKNNSDDVHVEGSSVEEQFQIAQAEGDVFKWNKMSNQMVNGYRKNEPIIIVDYPGLNGYKATITDVNPGAYPHGTMRVWIEDADQEDYIKSDRFVSEEEYEYTKKQANFRIQKRVEVNDGNEDSIADEYWSLAKSIEDLKMAGETQFGPSDGLDVFDTYNVKEDVAASKGGKKVFYITVPVNSEYSMLSSSIKDEFRQLEKTVDLMDEDVEALQTFESEVYINFNTKEDFSKFVEKSIFENTDFAFENYGSKHWEDMTREDVMSEMGTVDWPYGINVKTSRNGDNVEWRMKFNSDGSYATKAVKGVSRAMDEMGIKDTPVRHFQSIPDDETKRIVYEYKAGEKTFDSTRKANKTTSKTL